MHIRTTTIAALLAVTTPAGAALAQETPGEGTTVQPIVAPALEERFQHEILFRALEELGYEVAEPLEAEYQTLHLALGAGDADFTAVSWEELHAAFFEEAGGEAAMTKVGTYIEGALQGYLVNKEAYDSGVTSLDQLADPEVAARFDADGDGRADLAGCTPGWGCERIIEHQLDEYGLRDTIAHNQGAYNAIMADTIAREQTGEDVLYFTWTPYWVSGVLVPGESVEWLSVPYTSLPDGQEGVTEHEGKNLGFAIDSIRVAATDEFLEANPAAERLFEVATLDINDISEQNNRIRDGEDSIEAIQGHADAWIEENRETFDGWLEEARAAAQ